VLSSDQIAVSLAHIKESSLFLRLSLICTLQMLISFSSKHVVASPWIGTVEPQLHYDLQTLAEWGYLDAATTTYPTPWKGIAEQLSALNMAQLAPTAAIAAQRLQHYLRFHQKQENRTTISLYGASEASRFSTFDGEQGEKAQLNFSNEVYWGRWAVQVSANHEPGGENHFDQSFIAYQFGDWSLRAGAIDQWWGPAQSSSLILSNNARPIPALALSRSQATASKNSWLSFLGPWYLTAQLGQLESDRVIPDAKLWMTRFTFKPIKGLEIGASWSAMWGGQGQGNSLGDFFDVLTFKTECADGADSCDDALDSKKGNHLAGFDVKYSFSLFERPVSLYAQRVGEDAADYFNITDQANLFGISSYIWGAKVYLEGSNTNVACGNDGSSQKNCYYEHGDYQSGYRFNQRAIGSTFDSDAKMLSLGLNKHFSNGDVLELVVRQLTLNEDAQRPSPVVLGSSEELIQVSGFYQTTFGDWQFKLGAQIERSDVNEQEPETNAMLYSQIKYSLK
jgi:hypothetical protein